MTAADLARAAHIIRWWLRADAVPFAARAPVYELIRKAIESCRSGRGDVSPIVDLTLASLRAGSIAQRHLLRGGVRHV